VSQPVLLGVGAAGGLGAVLRFVVGGLLPRVRGAFATGTLVVNLTGAFALGLLVGAGASGDVARLLGAGLLGGYTTFSTWMLETERLELERRPGLAAANLAGSVVLGVLAVWAGRSL
jgi:CrcB protein